MSSHGGLAFLLLDDRASPMVDGWFKIAHCKRFEANEQIVLDEHKANAAAAHTTQ